MSLCLLEKRYIQIQEGYYFDKVILAKDLEIPHFKTFIFKNNAGEASGALKSKVLNYSYKTKADHIGIFMREI